MLLPLRRSRILAALFLTAGIARAQDPLARSFKTPPDAARPRVWWHWMNGNVSVSGIDQDFAWMKRVGIGGVQNFDGSLGTPRLVETPLLYMSDGWKTAFRHAVSRADSLGLEFTVASSPGWSETGGPWVKPEQAMKKLVWSERVVDGGSAVAGPLPPPPSVPGVFQDIAASPPAAGSGVRPAPSLYRDAAVIAYRVPAAEVELTPRVSASSAVDVSLLSDGDRVKRVDLPFGADSTAWVQFTFERPATIRGVTMVAGGGGRGGGGATAPRLQASDDGVSFRTVNEIARGGAPQTTVSFPGVTARYFRVLFRQPAPGGGRGFGGGGAGGGGGRGGPPPVAAQQLMELTLNSAARVHRFEDKAGWSHIDGIETMPTPAAPAELTVSKRDVVDLTSRMKSDGTLDWTPPPGRWAVLRLGWSLAGTMNRPASPEGTGLEVDKLSAEHVRAYLDNYLRIYEGAIGSALIGKKGLRYMLTDSYEAAASNWTDKMLAEFQSRRGYDPRPWLPVLIGRIVESAESSDRFLWDFRRTLSDLIADNHYGELSKQLHARGMGRYGESHEVGRAFIGDGIEVKKSADVPMGATWLGRAFYPNLTLPDIRESASVAHLYGQNLAAAESFTVGGGPTTSYAIAPEQIKPLADRMLANGLNRFVIHTSVHQPLDSLGPGIGLGPFGEWFTRKETWAEQAGPWISYLTRSSHMLQQGRFAADIAYLYGEDENITALFQQRAPSVPAGYAWDFVNADAVRSILTVKNGRITAPSGASYRMLVLDQSTQRMTVPTLRRIRDLVRGGAVVVGAKPIASPSLGDNQAEFKALANAIWGNAPGAGKVFATVDAALPALRLTPDLDFHGDTSIAFVHRKLSDGEVYFVANLGDRDVSSEMTFRVAGKAPELWRADDGSITRVSYRTESNGTVVPLALPAHDAVFVVFRSPSRGAAVQVAEAVVTPLTTVNGPWTLAFPPNRGAPPSVTLPALTSWTESTDAGVKYFSGTAVYSNSLAVPAEWSANGTRVLLDLGSVKNVAEVLVNGRSAGIAWKPPFRVDVTDALKPGTNTLEIRVSNLWPNRLIGDKQPGVTRQYAFAVSDPYRADSPLLPSGLLGPVQILQVTAPRSASMR